MASLSLPSVQPGERFRTGVRRRAGMRRPVLLILAVCNVLATVAALVGAHAMLSNPGSPATVSSPAAVAAADNEEAVSAFYAAVNEAIHTGDARPLDALVVPGVEWCTQCHGQRSDRNGLKQYVTDLHRTSPGMRLVVDQVVGGLLETVTVRVHVTGYPIAGATAHWGPVDTLRLVDGRIAERRSGADGAILAEPLLGARIDALPPAVTGVVVARLTFAVDAGAEGMLSAGPTLIVVESGALWARIAYGGKILRAGGQIETAAGIAGDQIAVVETVLRQGDGAIVPAAVRHSLRQDGAEPAVVVGATLAFQSGEDEGARPRHPEFGVFEPGVRGSLAPGSILPAVDMLVREQVTAWSPDPVRVALGRVVLSPGAHVVLGDGETLFVAVEAGTLALAGKDRTVAAGVGVMDPEGPDRTLRNAGSGLLVLLVLTIAPVMEPDSVLIAGGGP